MSVPSRDVHPVQLPGANCLFAGYTVLSVHSFDRVHGSVDLWISCFIRPVGEINKLVNWPSWSMDQLVNGPVGQLCELGKLQARPPFSGTYLMNWNRPRHSMQDV